MPNFIEIGQTSLEKSVTEFGPQTQQKRDYSSPVSQRVRGATKNCSLSIVLIAMDQKLQKS